MKKRYLTMMISGLITLIIFILISLCLGQYHVSIDRVFKILIGIDQSFDNARIVVLKIRLPRILMAILAGSALSVSGCLLQTLFNNSLATPDTLGSANGASFGACLAILFGLNMFGIEMVSLIMGVLAIILVYLIYTASKQKNVLVIILSGIVVSSLFTSLISLIKYVADPNDVLPLITFWLMGSLSSITYKSLLIVAPLIIICLLISYLMRRKLNVLVLSEDEIRVLGINIKVFRGIVIILSSVLVSSVVSVCGLISWIGLLIPHVCRLLFGYDNKYVIPSCVLYGSLFMLVVDDMARCLTMSEIPVSILTSLIGAPLFIFLLIRKGNNHD